MVTETPLPPKLPFQKAVAVKNTDETPLPKITASGRGAVAEKILELAFENDVRVRQDSDLTSLLEQFEVDSPVPLEALGAVTEILRYVYRLNGRLAEQQKTMGDR